VMHCTAQKNVAATGAGAGGSHSSAFVNTFTQ
jgi:hypothetical protein